MRRIACALWALALSAPLIMAAGPPSVPEIGSPELAALGPDGAGLMLRTVIDRDQVEALSSFASGMLMRADRTLPLMIWYPAIASGKAKRAVYNASLVGECPGTIARFTVPGIAVRDASPAGKGYPVVLLSHGYNNDPAMLTWLAENLATKGYVVVAIQHRDPPITDTKQTPATLIRRPLDIAFVLRQLHGGLLGELADTSRIGLAGYSFGGYGVITAAGAGLDPASAGIKRLPPVLAERYAGGGSEAASLRDPSVKAVIAIAPAGGAPNLAWGAGLADVHAPLLIIAGTADRTVGYEPGPASIFASATGADRYLLSFQGAGHAIGTNPPPAQMRGNLWNFDWFEDRVWRKERVNSIAIHFITAFLDAKLKGVASKLAYLEVPYESSDGASWKGESSGYAAVSQGGDNPTWKGFVKDHQDGLLLRHLAPAP